MGLEFLDKVPQPQRAGAINYTSLLNNLSLKALREADPQDFYPRDRRFLERLRWLGGIDPQILVRVRLLREKLLAIQANTDDPVPLVGRDIDTIIETVMTSFYDTGLDISGLTCSTLDLDTGFIGGDLICKNTVVRGDLNCRGLVVTGDFISTGLEVSGVRNTAWMHVLGKNEEDELSEDDLVVISQSLPPPPPVPSELQKPATPKRGTSPKTAAASSPKRSVRPQGRPARELPQPPPKPARGTPATSKTRSLRPSKAQATAKTRSMRPQSATSRAIRTSEIDAGWSLRPKK
jgi:hypothetical protein